MALFSRSKEPMNATDLSNITKGMHQAAASTLNVVAHQYIKLFDQFFDYDPEDFSKPMRAKMVDVSVTEEHTMSVPLISLVAPRGLELSKMEVNLSVKMSRTELKKLENKFTSENAESFYVTFDSSSREGNERDPNEIKIKMEFKSCEPPEGINRLIEEYTNLISPGVNK